MVLAPATASADVRRFGLMVDAGLPDGANGSLVYRPFSFLRVHAGGGHNLVGAGVRMGMDLLPFGSGVSLSVDGGHFFTGDANPLMKLLGKEDEVEALRNVSYDYANFHLGFEVGQKYATFYVRGGVSYINGVVKDPGMTSLDAYTDIAFHGDPKVKAWAPSARVGLIVYFAK